MVTGPLLRKLARLLTAEMGFAVLIGAATWGCGGTPEHQPTVSENATKASGGAQRHASTDMAADVAQTPTPAPKASGSNPPVLQAETKPLEGVTNPSESAADYEALAMTLFGLSDAWAAKDLDKEIEFFADDFSDGDVQSKEALHVALAAMQGRGLTVIDSYKAQIQISGGQATAYPVEIRVNAFLMFSLKLTLEKRNGKWLVVSSKDMLAPSPGTETAEDVRANAEQPQFQF